MRISNLGFARIRDKKGRYALLVNKRMHDAGHHVLSPIGGGLLVTAAGKQHLESLGAYDFTNNGGLTELRFYAHDSRVRPITAWLMRRIEREQSVMRELTEELTVETRILSLDALDRASQTFSHTCLLTVPSPRQGLSEAMTRYVIDVYDVFLQESTMDQLKRAARLPTERRWLHFVTRPEINSGRTASGTTIGQISQALLG